LEISASHGLLDVQAHSDPKESIWRLELGSLSRTSISIGARNSVPSNQSTWVVRQNCSYAIDRNGLKLVTDLELNPAMEARQLAPLRISLDPGLHLIAVSVDGAASDWELSTTEGVEYALINLQPPNLTDRVPPNDTRHVSLTAIGEFPAGGTRPVSAIRPMECIWRASRTAIAIDHELQLRALDISGGSLGKIEDNSTSRIATIDLFDRQGRITLGIDEPPVQYSVQSTFVWRMGYDGIEARCFSDLVAAEGAVHEISATIAPGWEVDESDVRVFDARDPSQPTLIDSRVIAGSGWLRVALGSALRPDNPLRLEISARRQGDTRQRTFEIDELLFVKLSARKSMATGIAVVPSPFNVELSGAAVSRPSRDSLPPAALAWIPSGHATTIFNLEPSLSDLKVEIVRDPPRVDAETLVRIDVGREEVTETYEIQVRPDASGVDRIRVSFWPPRSTPITWSMSTENELPVVEFRRSDTAQPTEGKPEVWDIKFHERQTSPLTLTAVRSLRLSAAGQARVTLASVEDATTQLGRVVVRSPHNISVKLNSRRMRSIAWPNDNFEELLLRGAFRYDPVRTMEAGDASLSIALVKQQQAWVPQLLVESQLSAGRIHAHRATWLVVNDGLAQFRVKMPPASQLQSVTINGAAAGSSRAAGNLLYVPLPPESAISHISVEFLTTTLSLGVNGTFSCPVPELDLPVLRREWRTLLPAGYVAIAPREIAPLKTTAPASNTGQRLFGPWYQKAERELPSPSAPWRFVGQASSDGLTEARVAALMKALAEPGVTWGQALVNYQMTVPNRDSNSPLLLVDSIALARAGITPTTKVDAATPHMEEPVSDSTQALRSAHLSVLVADTGLLLTDVNRAADFCGSAISPSVLIAVDDELLCDSLSDMQSRSQDLVTPQIWASTLSPTSGLGYVAEDRTFLVAGMHDRVQSFAIPASGKAAIVVQHRDFLDGVRVAFLLLTLGVTWWTAKRMRIVVLAACTGFMGGLALLAPSPVDSMASGAFLGLILTVFWRFVGDYQQLQSNVTNHRQEGSTSAVVLRTIVIVVGLSGWICGLIASSAVADEPPQAPAYPVWIPVNENREPTGDVYLPKEFYEELKIRAKAITEAPRGWLLLNANYELRLAWQGSPQILQADVLRIAYDIDVQEAQPRIIIPLPFAGLPAGSVWATLDDEAIDLAWNSDRTSIEVPIVEPGRHELVLRVQPSTTEMQGSNVVDLTIPSVELAQVQVIGPPNSTAVNIASAEGAVLQDSALLPKADGGEDEVQRWRASLGHTSRLRIEWPRQQRVPLPASIFTVENLSWLKLAGPPQVECKFRCAVKSGTLQELVIVAPAYLKIIPGTFAWERIAADSNSQSAYRLVLPQPAVKEVEVNAEFQLSEGASLGRMLIPQIAVRDAESITQSSLALSLPQEMDVAADVATRSISTDEFLRRWGESATKPSHAFQLKATEQVPQLLLRPRPTRLGYRENLVLLYSPQETRMQWLADVESIESATQYYEVSTPRNFRCDRVVVNSANAQDEQRELLGWSALEAGKLRLFLKHPPREKHQIVVEGVVPSELGQSGLPKFLLVGADCTERRIEIFRNTGVLVDLLNLRGFAIEKPPEQTFSNSLGRHFATLADMEPTVGKSTCTIATAPNDRQATGHQITRLDRVDDEWHVRLDIHLNISTGMLDELHLVLPAESSKELQVEPPVAHRFVAGEGGEQELVILPTEPWQGEVDLVIHGISTSSTGQGIQVPDVRIRDLPQLERYIAVPRTIESQSIDWQIDRLLSLSDERRVQLELDDPNIIAYRVVSDPFHAEFRALRRVAGVPLVRLADIRFSWNGGALATGWATFDIDPAGLTYCNVVVPDEYEIVHVRVGELSAQFQEISPSRWRIALRPQGLPQRIEVLYHGVLPAAQEKHRVLASAPVLEDLAVERTLWTILSPPATGLGEVQTGGELSPVRQDLLRLRSLTEVMRLPNHLRVQNSVRETNDWFVPWESRWQALRQRIVRAQLQMQTDEVDESVLADLQAIDADHEQIMNDLNLKSFPDSHSESKPLSAISHPLGFEAGQFATRAMVQGSSTTMQVDYPTALNRSALQRWSLAILAWATGAALLLFGRRLFPADRTFRNRRAIGVVVGIAWAIWLWPAWIGWLIVLAFLLPSHWPIWRKGHSDSGSAIIVRSSSSGTQA
jgi:hypothetical protein